MRDKVTSPLTLSRSAVQRLLRSGLNGSEGTSGWRAEGEFGGYADDILASVGAEAGRLFRADNEQLAKDGIRPRTRMLERHVIEAYFVVLTDLPRFVPRLQAAFEGLGLVRQSPAFLCSRCRSKPDGVQALPPTN